MINATGFAVTIQGDPEGKTMAEIPKITYMTLAGNEQVHPAYESALKRVREELGQHHPMYIGGSEVSGRPEFPVHSADRPGDPDRFLPDGIG